MSVYDPASFSARVMPIDAERVLNFGVGAAAAPLWATYFAAASAGMAYWWLTAWSRQELKGFEPAPRAASFLRPVPALAEPEIAPEAPAEIAPPAVIEIVAAEPAAVEAPVAAASEVAPETVEAPAIGTAAAESAPKQAAAARKPVRRKSEAQA